MLEGTLILSSDDSRAWRSFPARDMGFEAFHSAWETGLRINSVPKSTAWVSIFYNNGTFRSNLGHQQGFRCQAPSSDD
jgi:hypothetical protein